ncbi:ssDNA endonuclease and repair protein rad10 [Scheffersomyces spartinae]|uniref:SsDNA endonuclease and repair protein rad10 n=1 Tax=Scheffersomyces spartinae TaxID=45513 RepID=A0A9P8AHA0_9ASCO|nr:ssDNA endonuclease and repair protein rad10 [Scheffersomyces spartinae]KAG7192596.1 ssDNA endonuclease and repair protein rad10 [Scheffersomyces spartinae]
MNDETTLNAVSFANILAGVERMRQQYGTSEQNTTNNQVQPETIKERPRRKRGPQEGAHIGNNSNTEGSITVEGNTTNPSTDQMHNRPMNRRRDGRMMGRIQGPSEILVAKSQKGNPLFKSPLMKTASWRFDDTILSDYYISPTIQFLFLSLKYYKLRPEYIWRRIKNLRQGTSTLADSLKDSVLRILLAVVDIDSHQDVLCKLLDICIKNDMTLVVAWSFEEAGNYIVFAKRLDTAPAKRKRIEGVKATDYHSVFVDSITSVPRINKSDAANLIGACSSVKEIVVQSCVPEDQSRLSNISGIGNVKVQNLRRVVSEPFIYNKEYGDMQL